MLEGALFPAPNVNAVVPDFQNFLDYKRNREQERMQNQINMEKDMANFQSNLKLKEMSNAMDIQRIQKSREPLNVLPPTGLITPALDAQLQAVSERNKLQAENNMQRNQIAQQNADTKRELGSETIDARRDIAAQNNETKTNLQGSAFKNRQVLQDDQQAATAERDTARQTGRENLQNTRGQQIIKQIEARGAQDRLTKGVASPNVNANNPSQQAIAEKQRANQFRNQNPELAQWVNLDPNTGMVNITPPSNSTSLFGGKSGPTIDEYHRILGAIYGGSSSSYSTPNSPPTAPLPTGQPTADKVRVMLPDGRIGYMPRANANQPGIKILGGQ